jgi:hypothetical protein
MRRTVLIGAAEQEIVSELGSMGLNFKDIRAEVDDATDGLWIDPVPSKQQNHYLRSLGTK